MLAMKNQDGSSSTSISVDRSQQRIDEIIQSLDAQLESITILSTTDGLPADCFSKTGDEIRAGIVVSSEGRLPIQFSEARKAEVAAQRALNAAKQAAILNADCNESKYLSSNTFGDSNPPGLIAEIYRCGAAFLDPRAVRDTTGAGDAFIGSILYGISVSYIRSSCWNMNVIHMIETHALYGIITMFYFILPSRLEWDIPLCLKWLALSLLANARLWAQDLLCHEERTF